MTKLVLLTLILVLRRYVLEEMSRRAFGQLQRLLQITLLGFGERAWQ
jgi:hypothetical protein